MRSTGSAVLLLATLATTGCATMFNSQKGPISVSSQRPAQLFHKGEVVGVAPGEIAQDGVIVARAEGCEPFSQPIRRSLSGWFIANVAWVILFPAGAVVAPLGMVVDAVSGSMWKYSPRQFFVPCERVSEPGQRETPTAEVR